MVYSTYSRVYIFLTEILNRLMNNVDDFFGDRIFMCEAINLNTVNASSTPDENVNNDFAQIELVKAKKLWIFSYVSDNSLHFSWLEIGMRHQIGSGRYAAGRFTWTHLCVQFFRHWSHHQLCDKKEYHLCVDIDAISLSLVNELRISMKYTHFSHSYSYRIHCKQLERNRNNAHKHPDSANGIFLHISIDWCGHECC